MTINLNMTDIRKFGAKGDGGTDDSPAIKSALASGSSDSVFIPKGIYLINQDITIPSTKKLFFDKNARIKISNGKTLTINGAIEAHNSDWIFDTFSGGSVLGAIQSPAIYPEWFGAKGDGIIDDSTPFIKLYNLARAKSLTVELIADRYLLTAGINTEGASTFSKNGSILDFQVSAASGYAFKWGGPNVEVRGITFELSNSSGNTAMQGLLNSYVGANNQRFVDNKVIGKTFRFDNGQGNIYGAWFQGTGISNVFVQNNVFDNVKYAVQFNYQVANGNIAAPIGAPIKNIHISHNEILNSTIGINTPHIYCSNVFITDNHVNCDIGLPINLAHVSQFEVCRNIIDANSTVSDGSIHIEDVSYQGKVNENIIISKNIGDGIRILLVSGVSQDTYVPTESIEVANNDVKGANKTGSRGIHVTDVNSPRISIRGNRVEGFDYGVSIFSSFVEIIDCKFRNCTTCIEATRTIKIAGIDAEACTNIIKTNNPNEINGLTLYDVASVIDLKPVINGVLKCTVVYRNVQIALKQFSIVSNAAYGLFTLPLTKYDFNMYYACNVGGDAARARVNIKYDGSTFTATKIHEDLYGAIGAGTFTSSSNILRVAHFYSGSTTTNNVLVSIDSIMYTN